jgi:hypothetical protein
MRLLCMLMIFGIPVSLRAQETFRLPDHIRGTTVGYLEGMKIRNPSRTLSAGERHELCRLFVKAYAISVRRYQQDYLLSTGAPVYRLLVANFPELVAEEGEGGSVILLGAITGFFNKSTDYRPDVIQVLRTGLSSKYCNPL